MAIKKEIKKLGYKIKYVPHKIIGEYIACYNVEYKGKIIKPSTADKFNIPLGEIWISEKWKDKEENILLHELREIKYRSMGYSQKKAHEKSKK